MCRVHGGAAPQVIAKARFRILQCADPIAAKLIALALAKNTRPGDAIAACRDLLNRAGVVATRIEEAHAAGDGMVLWEEFVAIHRRRVALPGE